MAALKTLPQLLTRHALSRAVISTAVGAAATLVVASRHRMPVALIAGWDAGGLTLIALAWLLIQGCDAASTRERAAREDPGRTAVYVLIVLTSVVSLFGAAFLSRLARGRMPLAEDESVILSLATVTISWVVTHVTFTLRYAHLYYREDEEGVGGVVFKGTSEPSYFDFAYLAFTVGMCFQVSDMEVTSGQIRRAVLLHAVISFAYNTAIIAFALNLAFGAQ